MCKVNVGTIRDASRTLKKQKKTVMLFRCSECNGKAVRKYREKNREKFNQIVYKSIEKYRYKQTAREEVAKAIKKGLLERPSRCSVCTAKKERIEAHHPDYSKPLEVVWLCKFCHTDLHKKEKNEILIGIKSKK